MNSDAVFHRTQLKEILLRHQQSVPVAEHGSRKAHGTNPPAATPADKRYSPPFYPQSQSDRAAHFLPAAAEQSWSGDIS